MSLRLIESYLCVLKTLIHFSDCGRTRPGYVFVMTLAVIATLSLILAGAWYVQRSLNQNITSLIEVSELEQDLRSVSSVAVFALLTEPVHQNHVHIGGILNPDPIDGGLIQEGERISLRGKPYRVEINDRHFFVRIIAISGLLPLDVSRPQAMHAIFEQIGESVPSASRLVAQFLDYADPDQMKRLNGAEAHDYPEGRAIANAPLQYAAEACSILSWQEVELCEDPRLLDLIFSVDVGGPSNPAAMPDYILTFLKMDEHIKQNAQQLLEDGQVLSYADISLSGWDVLIDPDAFGYRGADTRYLVLAHDQDARLIFGQRIDLSLGSVRQPFERGFFHVIGGSWLSDELAIEGDIEDVAQFPGAIPEAD